MAEGLICNSINDQDRFIGRADVMRETLRVLRNPNTNAIVLHGQRRIDRTSILLRLEEDWVGEDYAPIYFDLQDKATMPLGDVFLSSERCRHNHRPRGRCIFTFVDTHN